MKTIVACLLLLVLVVVPVGVVLGQGPIAHQVNVGGPDLCSGIGQQPGCNANFALVAIQFTNGRVTGQYDDEWDGGGFHAVIDCLSVSGNEAWISGIITEGDYVGARVATRVRDNGTSAQETPDQISYSWIGDGRSCELHVPYGLYDAPEGQVNVK